MRQELTSKDRFYIPDPWDQAFEEFVETVHPAIVNPTNPTVDTLAETSSHQLAPAPTTTTIARLLQDELKLRHMGPSFFLKFQEILAHLYWADSICDA